MGLVHASRLRQAAHRLPSTDERRGAWLRQSPHHPGHRLQLRSEHHWYELGQQRIVAPEELEATSASAVQPA